MAKAPTNSSSINQNVTAEDIEEAIAAVESPPIVPPIVREQIGSVIVETNNAYVEDNTGKPIAPPDAQWEFVEETINGMKVTTYMDPVGGFSEETR